MATTKQRQAAKRNVKKAQSAARSKRTGAKTPKTRQELYREAQRRNLSGRSKMRRDELARALGQK
jgi:hypothetical protein